MIARDLKSSVAGVQSLRPEVGIRQGGDKDIWEASACHCHSCQSSKSHMLLGAPVSPPLEYGRQLSE